ncbi:MAG TPA: hypothetical protein VFZ48_04220 [Candidatus Saccharimonadales bacterium]
MTVQLEAKRVGLIFLECLIRKGENSNPNNAVRGINGLRVEFSPLRLTQHTAEIQELIAQLPARFARDRGASFLGLGEDVRGRVWTSSDAVKEQLVLLGIAIGKMRFLLEQEDWAHLPGGVPHVVVL